MVLNRKNYTPQEHIQVGMAFFLIGLISSTVADGRLVGILVAHLLPDPSNIDLIQGILLEFSIPILCASIFFNVRGLSMLRSK